jgi:chromosome segregation ATPase
MPFFEDMLSSSRGAGFIGTLLALVVLVGFGSLYMFVFDESLQGGKKSIETVIKEQTSEIKNLELSLVSHQKTLEKSAGRAGISKEFEQAQRLSGLRDKRVVEINKIRDEVNQAMVQIVKDWETYKEQYRIAERKRAEGESIGNILTKKGKSYKNVVIKVVEPVRISFRHSEGNSTVLFDDAPDFLIDRFQMTKEAAAVAVKAENANAGLADVERVITEIKQEIDYIEGQIKESDASYNMKASDKLSVESRITSLQSQINQYQSQIAAEANKSGLRNTNKYQAGIQQSREAIAREEAKAADFSRITQEYHEAKRRFETDKRSWQDRLRAEELRKQKIMQEMQNKKTPSGVNR